MQFTTGGVVIGRYHANGWLKPDGSWDYEDASRAVMGHMGRDVDDELEPDPAHRSRAALKIRHSAQAWRRYAILY
jgi:hypothetical protein